MKISIITPVYNRKDEIIRAINSVQNLKPEQGISYEHIIINDGSTDTTQHSIKKNSSNKLKLLNYKKNKGVNHARNAGVKASTGKYILFFDSDDELLPSTLHKIKNALQETRYFYDIYRFKVQTVKGISMSKTRKGNVEI
jgi:glycosyltransferase involved in cell wall biosynthesis